VKLNFFTIDKHSLDLEIIVQEQQVGISTCVQGTLTVSNTKNLGRVKGGGFNGLDHRTLCKVSEITHALIDGYGAVLDETISVG
jgi:hypothetical protein